jgi:hypothetical protein
VSHSTVLDAVGFESHHSSFKNGETGSGHTEDTSDPSYHPDEDELSSDDSSDVSNELSGTSDKDQPLIKRLKDNTGPEAHYRADWSQRGQGEVHTGGGGQGEQAHGCGKG